MFGQSPQTSTGIIPKPHQIDYSGQKSTCTELSFHPDDIPSSWLKNWIINTEGLSLKRGLSCQVKIQQNRSLEAKEYVIQIDKSKVSISGGSDEAIHYAVVSLIQLVKFHSLPLPEMTIKDKPVFTYRGMHLDVSRHFFTVDEVKEYLDFMAFYKFNHFHWHLTDDQGWRIEIKQFPKLTEVGAYRKETRIGHYNDQPVRYDGTRYGGFYTQEQIKDIVQYARDRNITIVPEIEMPGHARAALAAYPELSCTGEALDVATTWGVFEEVFCPSESTFNFLEKVLDEVVALFPGPYIHIGGDECPKTTWKESKQGKLILDSLGISSGDSLQSYFIKRIGTHLALRGKKMMGWDEIIEGGLAEGAAVMSWRGVEGGIDAARQQHDVVMTPGSHCYFDHYQSTSPHEPVAIGGYTSLEKVYHWKVIPESLEDPFKKYILGGQGNVWTEYMGDFNHVEYMAFARAIALSEVLWGTNYDYETFTDRFLAHVEYWQSNGVHVANKVFELKPLIEAGKGKDVSVTFQLPGGKQVWHEWGMKSEKGSRFTLQDRGLHHFLVEGANQGKDEGLTLDFNPHVGTKATIHMNPQPSKKYPGSGPGSIVNGIEGSDEKYGGLEWLGFAGRNVQVLLEWDEPADIQRVSMRFFKGEGQWIYLPSRLEIYASQDGRVFEKIKTIDQFETQGKVCQVDVTAMLKSVRFLKLHIDHYGKIPEGKQGAGHGAWLFVDEIVVE